VVTHAEYAIDYKDIALGAFFDIEGDFDMTSFDIKQAAERHDIEPAICRWICAMLESRNISATVAGETLRAFAARECPQGRRGAFKSTVELCCRRPLVGTQQ
jgi:hypothetical protein